MSNEIKSTSELLHEVIDLVKQALPDKTEKTINPDTQLLLDAIKENNNDTKLSNDIFIKSLLAQNEKLEKAIESISLESKTDKDTIISNLLSQYAKLENAIKESNCKPTESVEKEIEQNPKFIRRMWFSQAIALVVTCLLSVYTFKHLIPAFPFALGLLVTFIGTTVWLLLDEFMFEDYSIGRIGKNAVSLGLTTIAISILYFTGITIGNSYISNPLGSENEKPQVTIEQTDGNDGHSNGNTRNQQPSAPRSQGTTQPIPASEGTAQSEQ
jgi:hypothetical protein